MTRTRPFSAFLLCALVALTGGTMAVARGQAASAGQIVICTGSGPVTVDVDTRGQPVGPVHICPDCVMSLLAAVAGGEPDVAAPERVHALRFDLPQRAAIGRPMTVPRARAPPQV